MLLTAFYRVLERLGCGQGGCLYIHYLTTMPEQAGEGKGLTLQNVPAGDVLLDTLVVWKGSKIGCEKFNERFRINARCTAWMLRGMPVGFSWERERHWGIRDEDSLELPDGFRFLYDVIADPEQRGRGLFTAALSQILQRAAAENARAVAAYVHHANRASKRGFLRSGFHRHCSVWEVRWGKRRKTFAPGASWTKL